jgi:hypothetical protein
MTDFFDRVLARAGCPPPETDVVRARPRGAEPFEGRGEGGLPVLDETISAPGAPFVLDRPPEPVDPFASPQGLSIDVEPRIERAAEPAAADELAGRAGGRLRPDSENRFPGTRSTTERIEIHERHTEIVRPEIVSIKEQPRPASPSPAKPSTGSLSPAPSSRITSGSAPSESRNRPTGRRERRPPEPVIEVRIGRIDVVAAPEPERPRGARRSRPEPKVSLDDYLSAATGWPEGSTG